MTLSPISRRAGMLSLTAAVLIVLSQVMRLGLSWLLGPGWATTAAYTVTYAVALLGMGTLLLALTAIYTREFVALGCSLGPSITDELSYQVDEPQTTLVIEA